MEEIFKELIISIQARGPKVPSWKKFFIQLTQRPFSIKYIPYAPKYPNDPHNVLDACFKLWQTIIQYSINNPKLSLFLLLIFILLGTVNSNAAPNNPGYSSEIKNENEGTSIFALNSDTGIYELNQEGLAIPITSHQTLLDKNLIPIPAGYYLAEASFFMVENYIPKPVANDLISFTYKVIENANFKKDDPVNEYFLQAKQGKLIEIYLLGNRLNNAVVEIVDIKIKKSLEKAAIMWQKLGSDIGCIPSTSLYAELLLQNYRHEHEGKPPYPNSQKSLEIEELFHKAIIKKYTAAKILLSQLYENQLDTYPDNIFLIRKIKQLYKQTISDLNCNTLEIQNENNAATIEFCKAAYYSLGTFNVHYGSIAETIHLLQRGIELDDKKAKEALAYIINTYQYRISLDAHQEFQENISSGINLKISTFLWAAGILFSLGYGVKLLFKAICIANNIALLNQLAHKLNLTTSKQENIYIYKLKKSPNITKENFLNIIKSVLREAAISSSSLTVSIDLKICPWIKQVDIDTIADKFNNASPQPHQRKH